MDFGARQVCIYFWLQINCMLLGQFLISQSLGFHDGKQDMDIDIPI